MPAYPAATRRDGDDALEDSIQRSTSLYTIFLESCPLTQRDITPHTTFPDVSNLLRSLQASTLPGAQSPLLSLLSFLPPACHLLSGQNCVAILCSKFGDTSSAFSSQTKVPCPSSQCRHKSRGYTTDHRMSRRTASTTRAEIPGSKITAEDTIPANHGLTPVGCFFPRFNTSKSSSYSS